MKKGFTLIELLAVILILGIIALIAIPTVNNIISEARYGAFKSGNENIMREVEQTCQTNLIKGENPVLSYIFKDGKSDKEINVKGSLPTDGYIFINKNCEITNYYLTDGKNIYSSEEDVRQDYMLKKSTENNTSIFKNEYLDYFDKIISISFVKHLNIPSNAINEKDLSVSSNNKVKSWLVPNGENYDLYIGSQETIYANFDSSSLFADLINVTNIDLTNFNTSFVSNMSRMFYNCLLLENLDVNHFFIGNVTNMSRMFQSCTSLTYLDLSNWQCYGNIIKANNMFGSYDYNLLSAATNLITIKFPTKKNSLYFNNIEYMFACCKNLVELDLSGFNIDNVTSLSCIFYYCRKILNIYGLENWNTSNVALYNSTFQYCEKLKSLNLLNWDTSNATNMGGMFYYCLSLKSIDLSTWNTSKVTNMSHMFGSESSARMNIETIKMDNFDTSNVEIITRMFFNCDKIKQLDLSNWNLNNVVEYNDLFTNNDNLINITVKNATVSNFLIDILPSRESKTAGLITIKGDKSGLNTSSFTAKNWDII